MSQVSQNLKSIEDKIQKLESSSNRVPGSTQLVAVSKCQPQKRIKDALSAGHRIFGENRVQEAYDHWRDIKKSACYSNLKLHLIGPLQTNKAKEAIALFDVIETLDREKLARKLAHEMSVQGKKLSCFIQVNTGAEEQKAGIAPVELSDFLDFCRDECGLDITGLMCIPPIDEPPALHFALLSKLAGEHNLQDLSMGMSADYQKAIPLGVTYVRVGTGIFGVRESF